jgi:hypothetical protein
MLFSRLVLIYQMPKIGSQTIEGSLLHYSFPHGIRRFHYLSRELNAQVRRGVRDKRPDPAWKRDAVAQLRAVGEITRAIRLRRFLSAFGCVPKLEVITGVRELIGLVLSSIFENYLYFEPTIDAITVERCRKVLLHPKTFVSLRHWFDLELKPFIGIDVFKNAFSTEQGYAVYENRFARVLVYRFEVLDRLPGLLQTFLNWNIPTLMESNIGAKKAYAEQYRHVRENLRLPKEFVTSLYDDKLMRHFYSEAERRKLFLKWAEPESKVVVR